ncbi:MAG: hypothetical protein PVS3B3_07420 [Ktedonobacteraceae bacterium]
MLLLCILLLSACASLGTSQNQAGSTSTSSLSSAGNTSSQQVTYSNRPQDVILRTFYGGGIYGALEVTPDISLYGDGTYILGADRQGKLDDASFQGLLHTLTDTYGLLNFKRQQFSDIQDQNATFLEVTLNGKQQEFMYGSFGNQQESSQDMDEYHRLNAILTKITETLKGPTQPYKSKDVALLVHQSFGPNSPALTWPVSDFTLAQASAFECGLLPKDETSHNLETGCLKYLIPHSVILLNASQAQAISGQLPTQQQGPLQQGLFNEGTFYYTVTLRPLLPDELPRKSVAMFGSAQSSFTDVPLLNGQVPPVPTPTPST